MRFRFRGGPTCAGGMKVGVCFGHRGEISSLSFSTSGRRLASAAWDSTALIWDLPLALGRAPLAQPGEKELTGWWADLAGHDADLRRHACYDGACW